MQIGIGTQFTQRRHGKIVQIVKITKETKKQWVLSNGDRLRKQDLCLVGNSVFSSIHYNISENSELNEIKRAKILSKLKNFNFDDYKTETIEEVLQILEKKD